MPKTLLVADDSVVIQKLVGLSFANEEVDLITTDNGDDAVALARERKPDLVLADVVMPGMSGYEVCQAIKQDPELSHISVLLLTGTFEAFDENRAAEVGADGHITKPFEAQVLVERVNEFLNPAPAANTASTSSGATPPPLPQAEYDFFEENRNPQAEPPPPALESDDLQFGEVLDSDAPIGDLDVLGRTAVVAEEQLGDRTVAVMPEDAIARDPADPLAGSAPQPVHQPANQPVGGTVGETVDRPVPEPIHQPLLQSSDPLDDPGLTVLADFDFNAGDAVPGAQARPAEETILADDFSFQDAGAGSVSSPAPMLGDDLFGDPPATAGGTTAANAFEFDSSEVLEPPPAATAASDTARHAEAFSAPVAAEPIAADPIEANPILPATSELEPTEFAGDGASASPLAQDEWPGVEPLAADPLPQVDLEPEPELATPEAESVAPAENLTQAEPIASSEPAAAPSQPGVSASPPDLTAMVRERLHETLEKVAWEAFADLSDTIVRQVVERVESIAWEVIPQMTETLVQEEIRRMKGEPELDE